MKLGDDLVNISDLDDKTLDELVKGKKDEQNEEEKPLANFFDAVDEDDDE